MSKKLKALTEKLIELEGEICREIGRLYPPGCTIEFFIMEGQKVPSTGIVGSVRADIYGGRVSVRHLQAKANSRYSVRRVQVKDILKVKP
jgi:hypothetical protein